MIRPCRNEGIRALLAAGISCKVGESLMRADVVYDHDASGC
jgi:hypothetical protein